MGNYYNSYNEYVNDNSSEKIVLAHVHSKGRLFNLSADSGLYSKQTKYFVDGVYQAVAGVTLTSVSSISLVTDATKFYYDIQTSKLYLFSYTADDEIVVTYKFFFSNIPLNLSHDLTDLGANVYYEPRIIGAPDFRSQMAQNKKGISLISTGSIDLVNQDGYFKDKYEQLIWENKNVNIYSFSRSLLPSQAKLMFRGVITGKSFSLSKVSFSVSDDLYKLQSLIPLEQYTDYAETRFKRHIYGKANNVLLQHLDLSTNILGIVGTLSGNIYDTVVVGTGTDFLNDLSSGDKLTIQNNTITVQDVISPTKFTCSELEFSFYNEIADLELSKQYSNKNRILQVAGHAIKKYSSTITSINSLNSITLVSADGFEENDKITIGTESLDIRRVTGNTLILKINMEQLHTIGNVVSKDEVYNVRYGKNETLIPTSSYTIINDSTGCNIQLSGNAEFNLAPKKRINSVFRFINGRNKVWLGSPSFFTLTCVAQTQTGYTPTSYSLFGKYFSIYDAKGYQTAFWFRDNQGVYSSFTTPSAVTTILATSGNKEKVIELESRAYTAAEIAELVGSSIVAEINDYTYFVSGSILNLETVDCLDIILGTAGDTGFTLAKTVTGVADNSRTDLTKLMDTRDWLKSSNQSDLDFIEILKVNPKSIELRSNFIATTTLDKLEYKNLDFITNDTPVYCDTYGKTVDNTASGAPLNTGVLVVKDILKMVGLESRIDTTSFNDSEQRANQLISLCLPLDFNATEAPKAADIINLVNNTVQGSLHVNSGLNLGYDILDAYLVSPRSIDDSSVYSWEVLNDGFETSLSHIANYKFLDYDPSLEANNNSSTSTTSSFVSSYVGSTSTLSSDLYLYNHSEALEQNQREQFINSLSSSIVKIKGPMSLSDIGVGARVKLSLNGLYNVFGSNSVNDRIGVVSSVLNTGESMEIQVLDLGNIFSKAARIVSDDVLDYISSSVADRALNSFITANNGLLDDDEDTNSLNLLS